MPGLRRADTRPRPGARRPQAPLLLRRLQIEGLPGTPAAGCRVPVGRHGASPASRPARPHDRDPQQVTELTAMLADTASGQQSLFASPGPARRVRPGEAGRTLHRLIAELTTLAAAAVATKRVTKRRPPAGIPQAPVLFDDTDPATHDPPGSPDSRGPAAGIRTVLISDSARAGRRRPPPQRRRQGHGHAVRPARQPDLA